MGKNLFLGVDVGSTTLKAVILAVDGTVVHTLYRRTQSQPPATSQCMGACQVCGKCSLGAVSKTLDGFLDKAGISQDDVDALFD